MKKITHSRPEHDFFIIAQPPSVAAPTVKQLDPDYAKPVFELKDPRHDSSFTAELHDVWVFGIDDVEAMKAFSLFAYGIEAPKLKNVLLKRYPEIVETQKVHFLLLKKL
jgi:hypothetical protein